MNQLEIFSIIRNPHHKGDSQLIAPLEISSRQFNTRVVKAPVSFAKKNTASSLFAHLSTIMENYSTLSYSIKLYSLTVKVIKSYTMCRKNKLLSLLNQKTLVMQPSVIVRSNITTCKYKQKKSHEYGSIKVVFFGSRFFTLSHRVY